MFPFDVIIFQQRDRVTGVIHHSARSRLLEIVIQIKGTEIPRSYSKIYNHDDKNCIMITLDFDFVFSFVSQETGNATGMSVEHMIEVTMCGKCHDRGSCAYTTRTQVMGYQAFYRWDCDCQLGYAGRSPLTLKQMGIFFSNVIIFYNVFSYKCDISL